MSSRFHQLLKSTHKSLEDWIAPSMQVELRGPKNVPLCQIRSEPSLAGFVAHLWKRTAVSLPDGLLENNVKACPTPGGAAGITLSCEKQIPGETPHVRSLALWNRSLLSRCWEKLTVPGRIRKKCHASWGRIQPCGNHWFWPHKGFLKIVNQLLNWGWILHANPDVLFLWTQASPAVEWSPEVLLPWDQVNVLQSPRPIVPGAPWPGAGGHYHLLPRLYDFPLLLEGNAPFSLSLSQVRKWRRPFP